MMWSAFLVYWVVLIWRLITPRIEMQTRGPRIWLEILFLLLLCGYVILTAYGLGRLFLHLLGISLSKAELNILAFLIGLGAFSIGIMIIGLIGWLNTSGILAWLGISGLIAFRELLEILRARHIDPPISRSSEQRSRFEILLQTMILISIPLLLVSVVSPVWDYDALLYHLDIPRHFLAEGRISFDPEIWRSAYPFLGEMPFIVGMVFGLDSLGKLINLTYAVLFMSSVYVFSLRFLGRQVALTATAILIGAPAFLLWATWASVDYAWAAFEFWSVYAICLWLTEESQRSPKWLVLAGIMSGCAASIKYLSLPTLGIVGVLVVWKSIENARQFNTNWIRNLVTFGASAGLVMGAWYLKNWFWTGNPVYPLAFGGPGWEPLENQVLNDYVQSFGVGRTWIAYLLLPFNVYAYQAKFSTIPIEVIHPALWLSFLFPFVVKTNRVLKVILVYAALSFISWVITSQVIRFLVPLSAFAAIMTGSVIEKFPSFLKNLLKYGLIGGLMILSLIHQIYTIRNTGVWSYFIGQKSTAEILRGINNDFSTILYIQNSLPLNDRVMFLWDGRGYYCDQRCISDDEQSAAIRLSINSPVPQKLARDLTKNGITHLLLSSPDANWFIAYHDPHRLHRNARDYFTKIFLPVCGKSLFQDKGIELFEISCR